MKQTLQRIEAIKNNGFSFSFGEIIEQSFTNYKKIALMQGLVVLVVIIVFTVVIGSVAGLAVGVGALTKYFTDIEVNEVTSVALLINFVVTVIGAGIAAPFTAGLLKMAHEAEQNRAVEFSTVFEYYKSSYFKDLFISGLIISTISAGISTIISLVNQDFNGYFVFIGLSVISAIVNISVPILTIFTVPLIVFGEMSASDAIKGSLIITKSKFWIILFVLAVFIVCALLGLFAFCIGIFFTIPLIYSSMYIMYRTVFGIDEKNELEDIGKINF